MKKRELDIRDADLEDRENRLNVMTDIYNARLKGLDLREREMGRCQKKKDIWKLLICVAFIMSNLDYWILLVLIFWK